MYKELEIENRIPIILVMPVRLHLHFQRFCGFLPPWYPIFFDFISLYPYFHAKITSPKKFWLYLVSRVSFNLHAIHLLIASSNFTEIDLIH